MYQVLMDFLEPEIQQRDQENMEKGLKQGLKQGIQGAIDILRELGLGDTEIRKTVMRRYNLSMEETEKYL